MKYVFPLLVALLTTSAASAGDIYVCKGIHGEKVYQNTPCAGPDDQVGHSTYSDALGRPGAPMVDYGQSVNRRLPRAIRTQPRAPVVISRAEEPTVGYECNASYGRWIQTELCPPSETVAAPVDVSGITTDGTPINGFGTVDQQRAIVQKKLDRDAMCAKINASEKFGRGLSESTQSYERNKVRDALSCGR